MKKLNNILQKLIIWVHQQTWIAKELSVRQIADSTISIMLSQALKSRRQHIEELIKEKKSIILEKVFLATLLLIGILPTTLILSWLLGVFLSFVLLAYSFSILIDVANISALQADIQTTRKIETKKLF